MRNEWRSNLWMVIELVIVGLVLWVIFGIFAGLAHLYQEPKGIDFNNIYHGNIGYISKDASTYKEYGDSTRSYRTDIDMLLANLRSNPHVESIGIGGNSIPYNYNYAGAQLRCNVGDSLEVYNGFERFMNPDMIRTLRLTGLNGESTEQLAEMITAGKILISTADRMYIPSHPEKWVGKEVCLNGDSTMLFTVGCMINGIRRADYEPVFGGVIISALPEDRYPWTIAIRVRPGEGDKFMESLSADDLEFGNVYVSDLKSIELTRESAHRDVTNIIRNLSACALFMLMAVFLGFLGSFWYRTQQRVPELALRKVNGATNADLFRRFIAEGLILLLVATPFIAGLAYLLLEAFGDLEDAWIPIPEWLILLMIPVTLVVLALMITAGICLPAAKAMKVNPATALKDQ